MLHQTCESAVSFFVVKQLLPSQKKQWAVYVLEKRAMSFLIISAMLLTGTFIANFWCTLCFLVGWLLLRKRAGGYHASSPLRCAIGSEVILLFCLGVAIPLLNTIQFPAMILFSFTALVLVWLIGCMNHPNLQLNTYEFATNNLRAISVPPFVKL